MLFASHEARRQREAPPRLAAAVQVAGTFLDPGLLLELLDERRWRAARRGRSRPGAGTGWAAPLHADVRRVVRTPGLAVFAVGLLLVPYVAAVVVPPAALPAIAAVVACAVTGRAAAGLRTVARSAPLRRAMGGTDRVLLTVHLLAPLALAAVWTAAVLPAIAPVHPVAVALLPVGAVAVVLWRTTRPAPDYGAAVFETGFGAVPIDLIRGLVRGPDLLAVLVAVHLLLAA
ncbi:DUF6297 family protein [Pseudonocardia nigra]|uniref:DUF6297 family protein n=1 Tax=Pseudonocardia nigra TaxID=1921578 RepID=UPI0027E28C76|nr:DUF6297 family protein [Pseudonocardia nigra]